MKKLLTWLDNNLLKIGVLFAFLFIAWYPKLPSIHIIRTWVYIRLEDFVIAALVIVWLVQLIRRKVKLPLPVGFPIGIYWLSGLISLVLCLLFVGPHLVGFFPHLAILEYGRRIEYMILFFIAFTTVRSTKDIRDFIIVLCVTLIGIVLYGLGQEFYLTVWSLFPKFFEHYTFCFPSFQTGNEEFAKGIALCLPEGARIPSTFGGHYDLAAYLVVVLPILLGLFVAAKKLATKIGISVLFVVSLMLLVFTASRVSFAAYLVGVIVALFWMKQKKLLVPVLLVSIACLLIFSSSTAKRFLETFRIVNVVTTNQGQVVGIAANNLPTNLKNKIAKTDSVVVEAPPPTQNLPTGSSFITLSQTAVATNGAYIKSAIPTSEAQKLKLANGGLQISTVSGSFLIQKALVYDISFTTRFQAEWPNAWAAFMSDPAFGKGYSTITLATDNDYLRLLGESGFMGFATFGLIFVVLGIFLKAALPESTPLIRYFALGLAGGIVGLMLNASLIDVFEASKVAEPLWILLGIAIGGLSLTFQGAIPYKEKLKNIFSSHIFLLFLLCILVFVFFGAGIQNFFVADDFTWLKWAATAHTSDLARYFLDAQGSIYRPVAKIVMFALYNIFSFQPSGYHVFDLFVHFFIGVGIYLLGILLFKKKIWAWLLSALFVVLPVHAEVLFWISTISISLSTLFIIYTLVTYLLARKDLPVGRQGQSRIWYAVSIVFALLSVFSYEMGVVLPMLLLLLDIFVGKKLTKQSLLLLIPFVLIDLLYLFIRSHAHVAAIAGDYSYSIVHLVPNVIANFVNYLLATFVGEKVIAWQFGLRQVFKMHAFAVGSGLLALVAILAGVGFLLRKRINTSLLSGVSFGLIFAFVALLPFLGFGNMSERYGYLAAFGFVFAVIFGVKFVLDRVKTKRVVAIVFALVAILYAFYAKAAINSELLQWQKASSITYNTLAYFRVVKEDLPQGATLYISHLPTRYGDAWIFPVGFEDGLWFIYRDDSLKVVKTADVDASLRIKHSHPSAILNHQYVFDFDTNGQIWEY